MTYEYGHEAGTFTEPYAEYVHRAGSKDYNIIRTKLNFLIKNLNKWIKYS